MKFCSKAALSLFLVFTQFIAKTQELVPSYLALGETVPPVDLHIFSTSGDFKLNFEGLKGKVVILEFWATYCGPCMPAMDHLAKIQNKFPNDLIVIAVTDETRDKVASFLNRRPSSLLIGIDESKELNSLFYHQFMPHTVLIGPDGAIKAITSPENITENVIYITKSGADPAIELKAEFKNPEFKNDALGQVFYEDNSIFKTVLSPKLEGVQSQVRKVSSSEYEFINCSVPLIYSALIEGGANEVKWPQKCLEVSLETKHLLDEESIFCFKLRVPSHLEAKMEQIGLQFLDQVFELSPKIESRQRSMLQLFESLDFEKKEDEIAKQMKSFSVEELATYLWDNKLIPYQLQTEGIEARFYGEIPSQANEVNDFFKRHGYDLKPVQIEKECLILHKANQEKEIQKNF